MTPTKIVILVLAAAAAWWVSGFDPQVTGEDKVKDSIRRIIRCLATAVLVWIFFGPRLSYSFIAVIMIAPISIGLLWCSPLAELFAHGFHHLIDSGDRREYDPGKGARDLDRVASLLKSGRHEEALELCAALEESGDANPLVVETLLARAGIHRQTAKQPGPLVMAHRARSAGNVAEAETILRSLLGKDPANVNAALMLMRLYAEDLHQHDQAVAVLQALEQQPHLPNGFLEYAWRCLGEWGHEGQAPEAEPAPPQSVDELLACGYLGTAIEILEQKTRAQPEDFESWLKLAEAHGLHSGNLPRAKKIIEQMEQQACFSEAQIQTAKNKWQEWRAVKPPSKGDTKFDSTIGQRETKVG